MEACALLEGCQLPMALSGHRRGLFIAISREIVFLQI